MSKTVFLSVIALALLWLVSPTMAADPGKGNILIEEWTNTNNAVTDNVDTLKAYINAGNQPTRGYWLKTFDRPDGGEDYWGGRIRGYLYPPQTGDYTFWTCSDDDSEIWLSTNEDPANIKRIANVEGWMPYLAWDGAGGSPGTTFKSQPVKLEAGKRYYVETYFSDGTGGGFQTVGWGGPGIGAGPVVIDGKYLAPVLRNPEPMFMAQNPQPADKAIGVTAPLLTWTPGATAMFHDVYFGTDPNPPLAASRQLFAMYYHLQGLLPGTTYYWKVDEVEMDGTTVHKGPVWSFSSEPVKNFAPTPADAAAGLLPGMVLTWKPGKEATQFQVFFGSDVAAVTSGAASVDKGKTSEAKYDAGALRASTTYYWRVDAIKAGGVVVQGDVWSFSTANAGPANKIVYETWTNLGGTAVSNLTTNAAYPANPTTSAFVDAFQSPVDWADNYGQRLWGWLKPEQTGDYTFWIAGDDEQQLWLSTDGSPTNVKMIATVPGWTPAFDWDNTGGGAGSASQKSAAIKLEAGKKYFIMALGKEGGGGDSTAVAWQGPGIAARAVIAGKYVDAFYLAPLQAFSPVPANGAVDAAQSLDLSWSAGDKAQKHEVYFGDNKDAVAAADSKSPLFKGSQGGTSFTVTNLEWGKTYYWRVDETNPAEAGSPWRGAVWSFTTAKFIPVDDFEAYNDDLAAKTTIFDTWVDGLTNKLSGSTVGNDPAPFAETKVVHAGKQAMPLFYDNSKSPFFSEAEKEFSPLQDWTANGVDTLSLWVQGKGSAFTQIAADRINMSGGGHDIWDNADDFRYAYKTLTGDGTMVARVVGRGPGTNNWAKGGVMIRATNSNGSTHAMTVMTGGDGNGASFQRRLTANGASSNSDVPSRVAIPYWVKIERKGNNFSGYLSPDGVAWTQLGTAQTIAMTGPVLIGLCVTSHVTGELRSFEFDSISTTGNVTGAWKVEDIGAAEEMTGNSMEPVYVVITDSANKSATVQNPNPAASLALGWSEWKIPLSSLTGVNLAKVKKIAIGVGNKAAPVKGGTGEVFVDDIRVTKP